MKNNVKVLDSSVHDEFFNLTKNSEVYDAWCLFEKGKQLFDQDKFQESINCFDMCLEIDDGMALAWMYKSMALSEIGRDVESEKCFNMAIDLDPNSINVFDEILVIED